MTDNATENSSRYQSRSHQSRPHPSMPHKPGPRRARIAEMLRVDHAGEYSAVAIYRGQHAVFAALPHKQKLADEIAEMEASEHKHLQRFNELLATRKTRPSLLAPLWYAAGYGMGAVTALMGEKTAMACTQSVEDVIEKHYSDQIEALGDDETELAATISQFRDDELEHKKAAEDAGAAEALGYPLLSAIIKTGCRAAIKIAEKI